MINLEEQGALRLWYLSVVNELAQRLPVATTMIHGLWWQEIDSVEDLNSARDAYRNQKSPSQLPPLPPVSAGIDSL